MQTESVLSIEQATRMRGSKRQYERRTSAQWAGIINAEFKVPDSHFPPPTSYSP